MTKPSARRPYTPRMPVEERREQLLDGALQMIARDGFGAVTIDGLARELGVTRPVVYKVFDSLDALLVALLDRQEQRALQQLLAKISLDRGPADPGEYLRATIQDLAEMVRADPLTWRPIFAADSPTPRVVRERIATDREVIRQRIQALVELSVPPGRAGADSDPGVVAHALVAMGEYFGRLILQSPESVDAEALARTISAMVVPPAS